MWLPLIGLMIGFCVVFFLRVGFPIGYSSYLAIGVLAGLDSLLGGWRAGLAGEFNSGIFYSGFFLNTALAIGLTYFGDLIGIEYLYLAAVVAFRVRIFNNLGYIRRRLLFK